MLLTLLLSFLIGMFAGLVVVIFVLLGYAVWCAIQESNEWKRRYK